MECKVWGCWVAVPRAELPGGTVSMSPGLPCTARSAFFYQPGGHTLGAHGHGYFSATQTGLLASCVLCTNQHALLV